MAEALMARAPDATTVVTPPPAGATSDSVRAVDSPAATKSDLVRRVDSPGDIRAIAERLRQHVRLRELARSRIIDVLERWGGALQGATVDSIPGVAFLKLWLRRGTLEPLVERELGREALDGGWREEHGVRLRGYPLGVMGHWPAGNVEIQPVLSLSCSLLAGNAALVRVPTGLVRETQSIVEKLLDVDVDGALEQRVSLVAFDHARADLHTAMAESLDGAMIWGGREAVTQIRALPFPHWARVLTFGPRLSVAAMDAATWSRRSDHPTWCRRIARDVWQFDQQACSSPQTLFLERGDDENMQDFVAALAQALREENRAHPRRQIEPALTSSICLARASWLMGDTRRRAVFPDSADWTLLVGEGSTIPDPIQGRTLSVLAVESLSEAIARFDGTVQTLGLAVESPAKQEALAHAAAAHGVDRIVKLGRMHVFGSPWDGTELLRSQIRLVRHVPPRAGET